MASSRYSSVTLAKRLVGSTAVAVANQASKAGGRTTRGPRRPGASLLPRRRVAHRVEEVPLAFALVGVEFIRPVSLADEEPVGRLPRA